MYAGCIGIQTAAGLKGIIIGAAINFRVIPSCSSKRGRVFRYSKGMPADEKI
jgi:hypothetical protein